MVSDVTGHMRDVTDFAPQSVDDVKRLLAAPWVETFRFLIAGGSIKENEVESCAKTLIYAAHGLLALFLSGNGLTEESLFGDLDAMIDFILNRRQTKRI